MAIAEVTAVTIRPKGDSAIATLDLEASSGGGNTYFFGTEDNFPTEVVFTVTRVSNDIEGNPTTLVDLIYGTIIRRIPGTTDLNEVDNGADLDVEISLSEFIYLGDQDGGAGTSGVDVTVSFAAGWFDDGTNSAPAVTDLTCTNSSTRVYDLPLAMWLEPDLEYTYNGVTSPKLFVTQRDGRLKKPVVAVEFTATGSSTNVDIVSTMTDTVYEGSGFTVPAFQASLDLSGMDAGIVEIDAIIYPWVGPPFTISIDAEAYPSPNLTILKVVNDLANGFGISYAYVTSTGSDGSGIASATASAALALPFLTILAAGTAIKAFNLATYGRDEASGGVIRLGPNTWTHVDFSSVTTGAAPLLIEAIDPLNVLTTIYEDAGVSTQNSIPDKLKFKFINVSKNADSNVIFLDTGAGSGSENMITFESCNWNAAGTSNQYGAWLYRVGNVCSINCTGDRLDQFRVFATVNKTVVCIGSSGECINSAVYHAAGCFDPDARVGFRKIVATANKPASLGEIVAFTHFGQNRDAGDVFGIFGVVGLRGVALVGCIVEQWGGDTGPAVRINADGNTDATRNVICIQVTVAGARSNKGYNDIGLLAILKEILTAMCIELEWNSKSDLFPTIEARDGNFSIIYKNGDKYNVYVVASGNSDTYGDNNWIGQVPGRGDEIGTDASPFVVDFVDDQSFTGGNTGGGDYTPGILNELPLFNVNNLHYNTDLKGNKATHNSEMNAGAIFLSEPAPAVDGVVREIVRDIVKQIVAQIV